MCLHKECRCMMVILIVTNSQKRFSIHTTSLLLLHNSIALVSASHTPC